MRQVASLLIVLCAASLVVAGPPRRGRVVYVQQCPCPAPVIVGYAVRPAPAKVEEPAKVEKPVDPRLAGHLSAWERRTADFTNLRAEVELTRTDAVFKKATEFKGTVLVMKPNYAVLRLDNTGDPTKKDYEAFICDGKSIYAYNGVTKTVTEFKVSEQTWPFKQLAEKLTTGFNLLGGVSAKELHERFDITLFKTDENYIYLDIKPVLEKDQHEFKHLRLALYGPGANTAKFAYLPAQMYVLRPNDDTAVWKFMNPQVDIPGVEAKHFQYVDIKDKGWRFPPAPPKPYSSSPQ